VKEVEESSDNVNTDTANNEHQTSDDGKDDKDKGEKGKV